ncbi:lipopolysaccharide biosynthesis protein [Fibrobacter sp. UWH1]|uniref:lipopolysaccharide biosynthesis protein n=1 Tax=Fibrobacter sp. UWH1 TaxID=1964354 RepID=UPI001130CFBE|nr:hypothetical protein [Fibrobacter sp. UWH1]
MDKLGIVDFGIQNVVGGLASMFTFFRSSLSNATQRFLSIAIGQNSEDDVKRIFKQHQSIYLVLTILLLLLFETIGIYFLYNKLVIPPERVNAAFWVFQFTVASLCVTLLSVVYDAVLIAHENMKVYSYVGVFEALAKLVIAFGIAYSPVDRLISYAFLLLCVACAIRIFYAIYCKYLYKECSYSFLWHKKDVKETFSFVSWNVIGTAVWAVNNNGIDVLLNMFFGPAVNAAKGVASQVNFAITNFSNGFLTSVQPQLTKSYAAKDYEYLYILFFKGSKYSFLLLWFFCFPFFFVIESVLGIWLKEVPEYACSFVFLILLYSLVNSFNQPIWILAQAIGKLKWYICIGSAVFLMVFPISYVLLQKGGSPNSVFVTNVIIRVVYIFTVLAILRKYIDLSYRRYLSETIKPVFEVVFVSVLPLAALRIYWGDTPYACWMSAFLAMIVNTLVICEFGLTKEERLFIKEKFLKRMKK